ncbi:MAG: hypothetical protein RI897_2146 [Verrucomicrobiota bacterium]|jgi:hypothetical protein
MTSRPSPPTLLLLIASTLLLNPTTRAGDIEYGEMAGYLIVPNNAVDETYNAGFSLYAAAWPLVQNYPGNEFQTGLFGTWMHPHYDTKPTEQLYSDIEGGLGWWRDTRFATETPKFIMGGVTVNFATWANGPGAGKGRDWSNPNGKYGVAQLSPWVLWPPDGLNLKQGTSGELFGYGYLPLPLTEPKTTTAGKPIPTGNQCWTLFLNTENFKGPLTFFTPHFWVEPTLDQPRLAGMFLDTRPSESGRPLQMETQHIPAALASDHQGNAYARVAPTSFPADANGNSTTVHQITSYSKNALWTDVEAWFKSGSPANSEIQTQASKLHTFKPGGYATWRIYAPNTPKEERASIDWTSFATPTVHNPSTYGFKWNQQITTQSTNGKLITLPQFYRLDKSGKEPRWIPIQPDEVPPETGLASISFPTPEQPPAEPYITPEEPDSSWKQPGPAAGPFTTTLGDGSTVTYAWYRFADQPALLNADLTKEQREQLQHRVELLHQHWTKDRTYLPPPTTGTLASLDPALLVTPPKGLEIGYVPIVTRQAASR